MQFIICQNDSCNSEVNEHFLCLLYIASGIYLTKITRAFGAIFALLATLLILLNF